ncbi:MAG: ATP-binding protein [Nitrososphaerota archaeon]|nr:ATP-binding protein [Nitrososphaerota archaeon]
MNVSTFTKGEKYKLIVILGLFTFLLLFTRRLPFVAFAVFPALGITLLVMRGRLSRRSAKTPVRQVSYVSLVEPIYDHYTATVGRDEDGNPITERRSRVVGHKKREIPLATQIDPSYADILRYIDDKRNPSVLISGRPGMGKTELMKLLLVHQKIPKIVFSFKPNDAYLQLPYNVVDISRHTPDPFQDPDAFLMAYELANPANVRGIMLSEASVLAKSLASKSRNWDEFRRDHKNAKKDATDIQKEALALIEGQTESLAVGEGTFKIDLSTDTVLDFSSLGESAKTFYAEIALRQIWESLAMGPVAFAQYGKTNVRLIIVIDELHRLMQVYGEFGVKSVIDTLLRMVRQFGGVYAATQNHTDVPDRLRNLFGTQFVFNTSSENDLDAIRKVEPGYAWVAKELWPYHFIDVTFRTGKEGIFPVFEAEPVELPEREAVYAKPADFTPSGPNERALVTSSYEEAVRASLAGEDCVASPTSLADEFAKKNGVDGNMAKLHVSKVLQGMLNNDELQRTKVEMPEDGRVNVLYFRRSANENESPLHRWMVKRIIEGCNKDVIHVASSGEALPDVETGGRYVEAETGLKRRTDDLQDRITRFGRSKPFIIVVPNGDIKETYRKLGSGRVTVRTLYEFLNEEP